MHQIWENKKLSWKSVVALTLKGSKPAASPKNNPISNMTKALMQENIHTTSLKWTLVPSI